jgi:Ca-activated chloride channel family protein
MNTLAHQDYGFLSPQGLLLGVTLLVLLILGWRSSKLRAAARSSLGLPHARPLLTRHLLSLGTCLLLILAVSRPFWGSEDIESESSGVDVLFLVDISRSMYAQDVPPSRIELAKRKMKDLVQGLSSSGASSRFGITVFAGDGYTVCPVTTDRGVLAQFIDVISPDLVTSLGSNLKAGMVAALGRLDELALRHSRLILISDGEDNFFDQTELVRAISEKGVRVDALGVGTTAGTTITLPNGAPVIDASRQPVRSALNEDSLRAIVSAGGGVYVRASLDDSDVLTLSQPSIQSGVPSVTHKSQIRTYREFGPWLTLVALVMIIVTAWNRRINPLLLVPLIVVTSFSDFAFSETPAAANDNTPMLAYSQFESYRKGDYKRAAEEYSQALQRSPRDRALLFGLASSLYRLGKFTESAEAFHQLADSSTSGREYFESTYNEGNSLLALGRYDDAIDAYWRALDSKPGDPSALHNLAVARALREQQLLATPTPTPTSTPTPAASQQPEPSPQPSPEPSSQPSPQSTPDPAASTSPSPASSPSSNSDEQQDPKPSPAPSPGSTSTPALTPDSSTPSPGPSAAAETPRPATSSTPLPQQQTAAPTPADRLKEALESEQEQNDDQTQFPAAEITAAIPEADAWLESLPDSPLLIRRYRGSPSDGGQTW